MTFVFRHPKFYRIPRDKKLQAATRDLAEAQSDQAISKEPATAGNQRSPGSGPEAASDKRQAPEPASDKQQASSTKPLKMVDTIIKP